MYRITIECVPYENEVDKYPLKTIRLKEKGHQAFGYTTYVVESTNWIAFHYDEEPMELKYDGEINHDRRDGYLVLVRKALEHIDENASHNT